MQLNLNGFKFQELLTADGLRRCDERFLNWLYEKDSELHAQLIAYRQNDWGSGVLLSRFIINTAEKLDEFLIDLFQLHTPAAKLTQSIRDLDPVFVFKQQVVLKKARRLLSKIDELPDFITLDQSIKDKVLKSREQFNELTLSRYAVGLLEDEEQHSDSIIELTHWSARVLADKETPSLFDDWVSFDLPAKRQYDDLVHLEPAIDHRRSLIADQWVQREGFELTDQRMSEKQVLNEIDYCVYCHEKEGDYCSKGFLKKKKSPAEGFRTNPLGELLAGCPLEEKISEMHVLKKTGFNIGALATIMIDNPMCPVTGHRICNDCMQACIYQKQDPVNIPEIETRVLTDVIDLPWGVEIYDFLTRWNPLRRDQYLMKPYNGAKVLVMGMGPAGFTLAHHLLLEGFCVVGVDGLKLEPLQEAWIKQPIYSFSSIKESLADRIMMGFGGVAEYGITVRWDKNFLKLVMISLLRKPYFQMVGSMRFGGSLTVEDAWELGFDHLSVAVGAGLPRELPIENSMAIGMRQANDFLMALQLTGALKKNTLANLQIRMPVIIIGGGLTGVDAATEAQAYYLLQIEKMHQRYQTLVKHYGEERVRSYFSPLDLEILDEYISHSKALNSEKLQAQREGRPPDLIGLIRQWGGVTIVYRKSLQESPAYRLNHEELAKAMEQGLFYSEHLSPVKVLVDSHGHACAVKFRCSQQSDGELLAMPAKSILVATGAKPNVAYEFEHRGTFEREKFQYVTFDLVEDELKKNTYCEHVKSELVGPFTSYSKDGKRVSFLGDTHPVFHGSVVKAIASAKRIYPKIVESIAVNPSGRDVEEYPEFREKIHDAFRSRVISVEEISDGTLELKVYSPLAASHFYPGQFYRIQTYESLVETVGDTLLHMEALALIGIKRPDDKGILTFISHKKGVSSTLVERFKSGDRLSLMGPTGAKLPLPTTGFIFVVGSEFARIHILSIGYELKRRGVKLVFFSLNDSLLCDDEVQTLCYQIITIKNSNEIVDALAHWSADENNQPAQVKQIQCFVSADCVRLLQQARQTDVLSRYTEVTYTAAVFGPMQCMLKGVCAQCLQWQIDPTTGQRTKAVYACSWQNQPLELIDTINLEERSQLNSVQEVLSSQWLDYILNIG